MPTSPASGPSSPPPSSSSSSSSSSRSKRPPAVDEEELDGLRPLLCAMQEAIRDAVLRSRDEVPLSELAAVDSVTRADTIYRIDKVGEAAIFDWLEASWPREASFELVMEGIDDVRTFPHDRRPEDCRYKLIVDPIDGTRGLMHDKRSAWVLAGLAPQRGPGTSLRDVCLAAMSEIPVTKQRLADQLSGVRGRGADGLVAERIDLDGGARAPLALRPSRATDLEHGFASFARFFPEAKTLLSQFEDALWHSLYDGAEVPVIFDDQYICSGGQFYELIAGRDRMLGDLRPYALAALGRPAELVCHPYDVCTALLLEESGCPLQHPAGGALDVPLDTTSPVSWVGFANAELADHIRPALARALAECFPAGEAPRPPDR